MTYQPPQPGANPIMNFLEWVKNQVNAGTNFLNQYGLLPQGPYQQGASQDVLNRMMGGGATRKTPNAPFWAAKSTPAPTQTTAPQKMIPWAGGPLQRNAQGQILLNQKTSTPTGGKAQPRPVAPVRVAAPTKGRAPGARGRAPGARRKK